MAQGRRAESDRGADGPPPAVWSIVLSWNRRADTLACLGGLRAEVAPGARHHVLLVDNGSTDGTIEAVASAFPDVEILALPENVGFAAGMNAGIARALAGGAAWTLVVNNDTVAEPGMLSRLLAAAGAGDVEPSRAPAGARRTAVPGAGRVGLVVPTVVHLDRPERVWPSAGVRRRWTLDAVDTSARRASDAPHDVDWAHACCLLVRRAVWEDVGPFDERFRFYYEDHDLSLRARSAGWRIVHAPAARVRHRVAASTGAGSPRQAYLLARGSVPYYAKHTRGLQRLFVVAVRAGSFAKRLARDALAGRPGHALAYARGLIDGLRDVRRGPSPEGRWDAYESTATT